MIFKSQPCHMELRIFGGVLLKSPDHFPHAMLRILDLYYYEVIKKTQWHYFFFVHVPPLSCISDNVCDGDLAESSG